MAAIFGVPLSPGDQVLTSPWEYPSVGAAWRQRGEREGIEVVEVDFDLMDDDETILKAYEAAVTPRTRALQVTHMSHWTGRSCRRSGCARWPVRTTSPRS